MYFFFQAEDGIRDYKVTGVQTCALPISYEVLGFAFMSPLDRYSCEEVFRRIDEYVDRELAVGAVAHVRAHLETCAACAAEYAFEEHVLRSVKEKLRRVSMPDDLRDRIARLLSH